MKKTFPVNISGTVFYVDEDAYELLNNYLDQLRKAFPDNEGAEIVSDIEGRIAEVFCEMCGPDRIVTIAHVNNIIEKMGRPADLSSDESAEPAAGTGPTPPPYPGDANPIHPREEPQPAKKLFRDMQDTVLGGVLSGVAAYMGWNANILRLLVVIVAITTKVWPLFICYLIAWMVIPPARTMRQILEMRGEPVTVDSVSQSMLDNIAAEQSSSKGFFRTVVSVIFKIFLVFMGIVGICACLTAVAILIATLCGIIVYLGWGSTTVLDGLDLIEPGMNAAVYGAGVLCTALAVLLPCGAATWYCFKALGNSAAHASRTSIITLVVVELVLIIAAVVLMNIADLTVGPVLSSIMTGACTIYLC